LLASVVTFSITVVAVQVNTPPVAVTAISRGGVAMPGKDQALMNVNNTRVVSRVFLTIFCDKVLLERFIITEMV
jgi:hypothetical protein